MNSKSNLRSLKKQTAVITGASSGIGQDTALAFGRSGANVVVNYHKDKAGAAETCRAIEQSGGRCLIVQADVSEEVAVEELFNSAVDKFGQVDILISNAGIQDDAPLTEMTLEQWQSVIDSNLTSQFVCIKEATKEFCRPGRVQFTRAKGRIVCVSSVHELIPWAGHVNYASSKGGLMQLMKSAAQELSPKKIRINSIAPGAIKTDINKAVWSDKDAEAKVVELIPYGRFGETADVVACIEFLISDAADYVQGTTLFVDGGMSLYSAFAENG